jgi:hypothetical protein
MNRIQTEEAVVAIMIGAVSMERNDSFGIVGIQATQRYKAPVSQSRCRREFHSLTGHHPSSNTTSVSLPTTICLVCRV